jgi:hypothetical protein
MKVLRQQSKYKPGVQKMVELSSFMDGCEDVGMVKWYHRLLELFIINILQRDYSDGKFGHASLLCNVRVFYITSIF